MSLLKATIAGSLAQIVADEVGSTARALRRGVEDAAGQVQDELRRQVLGSGLRNAAALANAWRSQTYPTGGTAAGSTLHPAAVVYSKAPKIMLAIADAIEIVARDGRYLSFPTPYNQGRFGALRVSVGDMVRARGRTFVIASASDPKVRLWMLRGGAVVELNTLRRDEMARALGRQIFPRTRQPAVPMFYLLRSVRTRKRIDVDGLRERSPAILARALATELSR